MRTKLLTFICIVGFSLSTINAQTNESIDSIELLSIPLNTIPDDRNQYNRESIKKPTSILNLKILQFLFSDENLKSKLKARDQNKKAAGVELSCKFMRKDEDNPKKSIYMVQFIYSTEGNYKEDTDDLHVMVEVTNSKPVQFDITYIKKF